MQVEKQDGKIGVKKKMPVLELQQEEGRKEEIVEEKPVKET